MQESGENYLETILLLQQRQPLVRSVDIANELGYSKPSISRAMGILKKAGLIQVEPDGNVILTEAGMQKAEGIYERHLVITTYLIRTLGIDEKLAAQDACRIEHIVSDDVYAKMKEFVEKT